MSDLYTLARLVVFCFLSVSLGLDILHSKNRSAFKKSYHPSLMGFLCGIMICFAYIILARKDINMFYETTSFILLIALYVGLYYTLLVPSIRFLRKYFSAYTCAIFWILPNYLYFTMLYGLTPKSFYIIKIHPLVLQVLATLWFCGFTVSFAYSVYSHYSVRKKLLENIYEPVAEVQELWRDCMQSFKTDYAGYHLAICPKLKTPLTIGIWRSATYVLLPEKEYTKEELEMIFQHELAHIIRGDPSTKMDMAFFTALNWFNPFMYKAIKKASEDLELSCDEIVIRNYTDEQKQKYARLILTNTSETKGFTTCLSASADSLRYRLKEIVHPQKKRIGILLVVSVFLIMAAGFGITAFAVENGTLQQHMKNYTHIDYMSITGVQEIHNPYEHETEILSVLGNTKTYSLYSRRDSDSEAIYITLSNPERDRMTMQIKDHTVEIFFVNRNASALETYYIDETAEEISKSLLACLDNR